MLNCREVVFARALVINSVVNGCQSGYSQIFLELGVLKLETDREGLGGQGQRLHRQDLSRLDKNHEVSKMDGSGPSKVWDKLTCE